MNTLKLNTNCVDFNLARLRPAGNFGMTNGGWCYDAYPDLKPLDAGARICIGDIGGPAVITHIHSTQHLFPEPIEDAEAALIMARGIMLEIEFDEIDQPSVRVPLGDFFADGNGLAEYFTSPFIEKAPKSYNCFIPMPFSKRARVWLHNQTPYNFANYSFVEFERLPQWDSSLGYFHATWQRVPFALYGDTVQHMFHTEGRGHFLGTTWTVTTDEPFFKGMQWVMEGNVEIRVDDAEEPVANYLGSEDSFGFSWGFRRPFAGLRNGLTYIRNEDPSQVIAYRFRDHNVIPFEKSLDVCINWSTDWRRNACGWNNLAKLEQVQQIHKEGMGWIDYATVWYWYQDQPGYAHGSLMPYEQRIRGVLRGNGVQGRTLTA